MQSVLWAPTWMQDWMTTPLSPHPFTLASWRHPTPLPSIPLWQYSFSVQQHRTKGQAPGPALKAGAALHYCSLCPTLPAQSPAPALRP